MEHWELSLARRFLGFLILGSILDLSRLLGFHLLWKYGGQGLEEANFWSLPPSIIFAFALYAAIIWRDRPGSLGGKFIRFLGVKSLVIAARVALFSFWIVWFPCPFFEIAREILNFGARFIPFLDFLAGEFITCGWMSVATMDFAISITLGFALNNWFAFWKRR